MTKSGKEAERRPGKNVLSGIVSIVLCVGLFGVVMGPVMGIFPRKDASQRQREAVEKMIAKIPVLQTFVEERLEALNDVAGILEAHGYSFDLEDTEIYTAVEKRRVRSLFADPGPLATYTGGQFLLREEEYSLDDLAELRLARIGEFEVENWLPITYYMEEIAPGWYAYVTPCIHPNVFLKLDVYRSEREDGGLVRLTK